MTLEPEPIPEFQAEILSAASLNRLRRWTEYLLGYSHRPFAGQFAQQPGSIQSTSTSYQTVWTWYMRHTADTLVYAYKARSNDVNGHWYLRLQVYDDNTTWTTVHSNDNTGTTWQTAYTTADISGNALTEGTIYCYRLQIMIDNASRRTEVDWWYLAERATISGWAACPTFTDTTSAVADVDLLRTNINALNGMVSPVNVAGGQGNEILITSNGVYTWYASGTYRYHPATVYAAVRCKLVGTDTWRWRVSLTKWSDSVGTYSTLYESGAITGTGVDQWDEEDAISLAGAGLTRGDLIKVTIHVQRVTGTASTLHVNKSMIFRTSAGTPYAGWQALDAWAHGETNVSAAKMNKYSTDLTMLYSGGETLYGETMAVSGQSGLNDYGQSLVHGKRWLHYLSSGAPTVIYGSGWTLTQELDDGSSWQVYDLDQLAIPYGAYYYVNGCYAVMEMDSA